MLNLQNRRVNRDRDSQSYSTCVFIDLFFTILCQGISIGKLFILQQITHIDRFTIKLAHCFIFIYQLF